MASPLRRRSTNSTKARPKPRSQTDCWARRHADYCKFVRAFIPICRLIAKQVEDLFYNVPSRQRAFKSPSEEYAKILDVVGRYAVHCTGVAFSCKKHGESALGISTPSNATTVDSIRQIHGSSVANELVEFNISNAKYGFKASGWTTNANYHVKKTMLLLFINHRSVESSSLKKAVEQAYATFLPKGGHPFVYINLEIDPQRVDVNVHPTKREVNFLNEDEIIEEICSSIRMKLSEVDTSRTFLTQSLLPGSNKPTLSNPSFKPPSFQRNPSSVSSLPAKPVENTLVRTDPSSRKITSMLSPATNSGPSSDQTPPVDSYIISPRVPTTCRLTTIKELRASVRDAMHASLTEMFASHTYVGLVDPTRRIAAIQGGVKLFLVDYGMLCNEYFYQLGLTDFGNFGRIQFEPALDIRALVTLAVKTERRELQAPGSRDDNENIQWEDIPELVTGQLVQRREMLLEYFSMEISPDGALLSIPLLLKGYTPSLTKLPRFLMRLGPCVDWNEEKACFDSFLKELAAFYTVEQLPTFGNSGGAAQDERNTLGGIGDDKETENNHENPDQLHTTADKNTGEGGAATTDNTDAEIKARAKEVQWALEHVLFPAIRARLIATKALLRGVVEVADLKGLYRVFERC